MDKGQYERYLRDILGRITLFRTFSIFLNLFCVVQLILVVCLPDVLPGLLKVWLATVTGGAFLGITIGLFLARKDPSTGLYLTYLSAFISGIVFGVTLVVIAIKVKN